MRAVEPTRGDQFIGSLTDESCPRPHEGAPPDLLILTRGAIEGGLLDLDDSLLFEGIARGYALSRKRAGNPLDQFQMDLQGVTKVERLSDGQVPIVQWLTNAAIN